MTSSPGSPLPCADGEGSPTALPKRKPIRLPDYDYSSPGAYFVTVCTKDRQCLFWNMRSLSDPAVGAAICRPSDDMPTPLPLSGVGKIVDRAIRNISSVYPAFTVDRYVIMPNHVHMILRICTDEHGRQIAAPTLSSVVGHMKRWASMQAGRSLWQKSFHEHVIRNEKDYLEIWSYIDTNPARWTEDRYFSQEG